MQELKSQKSDGTEEIKFDSEITKNSVKFYLGGNFSGKDVHIYVGEDYLLTVKIGNGGVIKINKNNKIGKILTNALNFGEKIRILA